MVSPRLHSYLKAQAPQARARWSYPRPLHAPADLSCQLLLPPALDPLLTSDAVVPGCQLTPSLLCPCPLVGRRASLPMEVSTTSTQIGHQRLPPPEARGPAPAPADSPGPGRSHVPSTAQASLSVRGLVTLPATATSCMLPPPGLSMTTILGSWPPPGLLVPASDTSIRHTPALESQPEAASPCCKPRLAPTPLLSPAP